MIVIVGHGPSILSGRGAVIDSHTVVRLKRGLARKFDDKQDPLNWGTRTDYLFARSLIFQDYANGAEFWLYRDERADWFKTFAPKNPKPSTGLCAVFAAVERFKPDVIGLIGYDRLLYPGAETPRWDGRHHCWGHDEFAEHRALTALGVRIVDLAKEDFNADISGLRPAAGSGTVARLDIRGQPLANPLPAGCRAGARARKNREDQRADRQGHQE